MNQLFQQLNQQLSGAQSQPQNKVLAALKQKYQQCKMMADPLGYINNLPEMKNLVGLINQNGGNAKEYFYKLAEEKGVNPNDVLDIFK